MPFACTLNDCVGCFSESEGFLFILFDTRKSSLLVNYSGTGLVLLYLFARRENRRTTISWMFASKGIRPADSTVELPCYGVRKAERLF